VLPLLLSDFSLTFGRSPLVFVLLAGAAVAFAVLIYRYTLPPISGARRMLLWTLRGLALALILLMIFEPVLNFIQSKNERPTIAVLVDRSASMGIAVEHGRRSSDVATLMTSAALRDLNSRAHVRTFVFADSVREIAIDSLGSVAASGVGTNLAFAWERVTQSLAGEHLSGIVLVSDGVQNSGPNPERAAADSRVPLCALGVGDTSFYPDAVIAEILTNDVTYVGSTVPVDVRVQASGLAGKTTRLRLVDARGNLLAEENVHFDHESADAVLHSSYRAEQAGEFRLTAILDSVAGEKALENNRRSVIINVLESKAKVVLISGPPTSDLATLRQTLEGDSTLDVALSVELAQGKKLRGSAEIEAALFEQAKLVVLCNYPSAFTANSEAAAVAKAIQDHHVPVLFLAGPQLSVTGLNVFEAVWPLRAGKQVLSAERVVVRESESHPAISGSSPLPSEWASLPPVNGGPGNFTVLSGVQVVAKLSREVLGVQENEPAVALWELNQHRGAAFLVWNCAQWKYQLAATPTAAGFYEQLNRRIVRWLVAPADEKRFVVRTNKKLYSGEEKVHFSAQVYGADLQPRDDALIELNVTSGSRTESVPLRGRGNGRYEGELAAWGEGEYRFRAVALTAQDTLGRDQGLFAVEAFNIELLNPRARFDVLRGVAQKSGGQFAPIERAAEVFRALNVEPREITRKREIPLWNQALLLWVIIALLAAEWTIRKRSGMQ
jgi:hypothetical protein